MSVSEALVVNTPPLYSVPTVPRLVPSATSDAFLSLLERRRSIRRLRAGSLTNDQLDRILEAVRLTPAAYNLPPWHVIVVQDQLPEFWQLLTEGVTARLDGDRRQRHLDRLNGFRPGAGVALVFEDVTVRPHLAEAWSISSEQADAFVQQGLGMVQLAIWLAITGEGLVASLQHWEWLLDERINHLVALPVERFRLIATLPFGHADEEPRPVERIDRDRVASRDRARTLPVDDAARGTISR